MAIITTLFMSLCLSPVQVSDATQLMDSHENCVNRSIWFDQAFPGVEGIGQCDRVRKLAQATAFAEGKGLTHVFFCETDPHAEPLEPEADGEALPAIEEGPTEECRTELCRYVRESTHVSFHL